jgi:hypothetical protein
MRQDEQDEQDFPFPILTILFILTKKSVKSCNPWSVLIFSVCATIGWFKGREQVPKERGRFP